MGKNHPDDVSLMISSTISSPPTPFRLYHEKVFGPMDKKEVIYTMARFRTLSTK